MLMALLYEQDDIVAAAAPACDVTAYGNRYWHDIFPGEIQTGSESETAYIYIAEAGIRNDLLRLGIDAGVDGYEMARKVDRMLLGKTDRRDAA